MAAQRSTNNSDNEIIKKVGVASTSNDWLQQQQPAEQGETSRRLSKDESTSSFNSESPQSGDEYNVYFYNSKDVSETDNG